MKPHLFLFFSFLLALNGRAAQWTVSNTEATPAQFSTIQEAIDASSAGDTIYIQASTLSYPTFTLNKPVSLIGAGWLDTQTRRHTHLEGIIIDEEGSGSRIEGARFTGDVYASTGADNITVQDCLFQISADVRITGVENCDNWLIQNCVFTSGAGVNAGNKGRFWTISNCIFTGSSTLVEYLTGDGNQINNCIINVSSSNSAFWGCHDVVLRNNIIIGEFELVGNEGNPRCMDCVYNNNIRANCTNCVFPSPLDPSLGNSNFAGLNIDEVLEDWFTGTNGAFDYYANCNVLEGSVADGGGFLGTDIGVYGGSSPFVQGTLYHAWPNTPQLKEFGFLDNYLPEGDSLHVGGTITIGHGL